MHRIIGLVVVRMPLEVRASRFAVLPDDDLTNWVEPKSKKKSPANANQQQQPTKKKQPKKQPDEAERLRQEAFNIGGKKNKNKKKQQHQQQQQQSSGKDETKAGVFKATAENSEQFEAWKELDTKAVDDVFQKDIERAMMLSMVQAEEDQTLKRERDQIKAATTALAAAKKKMTLTQFHQMSADQLEAVGNVDLDLATSAIIASTNTQPDLTSSSTTATRSQSARNNRVSESSDFFSEIDKGAKKIVNREKIVDSIRSQMTSGLEFEADGDKEQLKEKNEAIAKLSLENGELQAELSKVKSRYKTMRGILDQCEIREKAEIVAEVIKLRNVKDEMAEEVQRLSEELEQSKTRVVMLEKQLKQQGGQDKRPK